MNKHTTIERCLPLLLLAITMALALPIVPSAVAAPRVTLKVSPISVALVGTGMTFTTAVTVSNMPPINGFDIHIDADPAVLSVQSVTTGTFLASPFVFASCVKGVGSGCTIIDGGGGSEGSILHFGAISSTVTTASSGTLFTITWKALNGMGRFGSVGSYIVIPCFVLVTSTFQVADIVATPSVYGTVPSSGMPGFSLSSSSNTVSVPAGSTGSFTVLVTPLNGFSNDITLLSPPMTSSSSVTASVSLKMDSCDCVLPLNLMPGSPPPWPLVTLPTTVLTINTTTPGTFTVTVTGRATDNIPGIGSVQTSLTITVSA